jgi:type VI protein secretion system component VasK
MQTLKLVAVLGVGAAGVAIGLAYLVAALTGGHVSGDEAVRHVILAFVVIGCAVPIVRRRPRP